MGSGLSCCSDQTESREINNQDVSAKPTSIYQDIKTFDQIEGAIKKLDEDVINQEITRLEAIEKLKSLIKSVNHVPGDEEKKSKLRSQIASNIQNYQNQNVLLQTNDGKKNVETGEYSTLKTQLQEIKSDLNRFDNEIAEQDTKSLQTLSEEIQKRHKKINDIDTNSYPQLIKDKEVLQKQASALVKKVLEKIENEVKKPDARKLERGSKYYEDMFSEINKIVITEEENLKTFKDEKINFVKDLIKASTEIDKIEHEIVMLEAAMKSNTILKLQSETEDTIKRSMGDLTSIDVKDDQNLTKRKEEVLRKITEVQESMKPVDVVN